MGQLSRLRWLCRRGMKELDVLLERFLAQEYPHLNAAEQAAFQRVLQMEDPELYACLLGQTRTGDVEVNDVIARIRGRTGT